MGAPGDGAAGPGGMTREYHDATGHGERNATGQGRADDHRRATGGPGGGRPGRGGKRRTGPGKRSANAAWSRRGWSGFSTHAEGPSPGKPENRSFEGQNPTPRRIQTTRAPLSSILPPSLHRGVRRPAHATSAAVPSCLFLPPTPPPSFSLHLFAPSCGGGSPRPCPFSGVFPRVRVPGIGNGFCVGAASVMPMGGHRVVVFSGQSVFVGGSRSGFSLVRVSRPRPGTVSASGVRLVSAGVAVGPCVIVRASVSCVPRARMGRSWTRASARRPAVPPGLCSWRPPSWRRRSRRASAGCRT